MSQSGEAVRFLIIDDHPLFREALTSACLLYTSRCV